MSGVGQLRDGDSSDYLELKYLTCQYRFLTAAICRISLMRFRHTTTVFEPIVLWILKPQRQWLLMTSRTKTLFQSITIDGKNSATV
jgi:hypothetical protein